MVRFVPPRLAPLVTLALQARVRQDGVAPASVALPAQPPLPAVAGLPQAGVATGYRASGLSAVAGAGEETKTSRWRRVWGRIRNLGRGGGAARTTPTPSWCSSSRSSQRTATAASSSACWPRRPSGRSGPRWTGGRGLRISRAPRIGSRTTWRWPGWSATPARMALATSSCPTERTPTSTPTSSSSTTSCRAPPRASRRL
mmetsp:Transcript_104254/g.290389  ORF Transcript_104254/g.290389 Transcript_104254/m.290389 type:complete len:200 (-) Transcript_104254:225-824(-)